MPGPRKGSTRLNGGGASSPDRQEAQATAGQAFPIVGLGASAGGVEALTQFFRHLPDATGMAFVVILHLAPEKKSHLAEVLQKHTALPVTEVTEDVAVAPDHVYIIPPGKDLTLADGRLRLSELEAPPGRRLPTDRFFRILAQIQGPEAVCVILSGTGSDGTLGLKAIKETGGLAMVQDPEEAAYDGMPKAALATGLVDVVLPVKGLAEKLMDYRKHAATIALPAREDLPEEEAVTLGQILAHLRARTGHDFTPYKRSTVLRRVTRRLHICGAESLAAYLRVLRESPDEPQALLRDLLITVTNFFRDPAAFAALEEDVIPKHFEGKGAADEVHVWVAGCATGEEAYSLAMLLVEHAERLEQPPQIQLFATDISEEAIATARQGLYPDAIAADLSPERLRRFFTHEASSYRVKKEIREVVLFAMHDLLHAPPFSRLDLISCRNLLIYLNREMQERVFEVFHYALNPGRYLFLGTSETPVGSGDLFTTVSKEHHLFQRGAVTRAAPPLPALPLAAARDVPSEAKPAAEEKPFGPGALHHKLVELYAPPSLVVNEHYEVLHLSDTAGRYVRPPGGLPTRDVLQLVPPELGHELRKALYRAFKHGTASRSVPVRVQLGDAVRYVRLIVRPAAELGLRQPFALVLFDEREEPAGGAEVPEAVPPSADADAALQQMEDELRTTKEQLRATVEQYETSNEELQSINEELRSTTEELETSKEELQSTNEELVTVNQEHRNKIEELAQANSDLKNLMAATEIGTIFLDRDLSIKRITPPIEQLFNITSADEGRQLAHFTHKLGYPKLLDDARQVLRRLVPIEREVRSEAGRWYLMRLRPYRTVEDKIDGVVITFVDITGLKQAQLALEDARVYAECIVNTVREPLVVLDTDLRVVSANHSFYDTFEVRPEEMEGRLIYELGNNQWDIPRLRELLEEILPENKAFNDFEVEHPFEQIGRRTMLLNAHRIDARQLILLAIEDVTRRKAAEAQLGQEKDRAQLYLDVAGVMMVALDHEGHITMINRAGCELLGYPEGEIVGKDWFAHFLPERDREAVRKVFEALLPGEVEAVAHYENAVLTRSGEERSVLWHNAVVRNEQGEVIGTLASGTDITERKQAGEALEESRARAEAILDTTLDAVITIDEHGLIESVNPATAQLFGYTDQEMIGQNVKLLMPSPYHEEHDHYLRSYLKTGEKKIIGIGREVLARRKDGTVFPIDLAVSEVRFGDRRIFTGFIRDVSERRRLEQEVLRISEAERQQIGQDIHDGLASQFSGIALMSRGLANQAKKQQPVSAEILEEIAHLAREGNEQARALARGLNLVKLDKEGLRSALQELVHSAEILSGMACSLDMEEELPPLESSASNQLYRIAQEATSNAIKHAGATHLFVRVHRKADRLVLIVQDDGRGLPEDPRVQEEARGMGLHIMPYRARMLGATLTIDSAPGAGTTVACSLPLAKVQLSE